MKSPFGLRQISVLLFLSLMVPFTGPQAGKFPVSEIKRAAIVSLYANEKVPKKGGGGIVTDWNDDMKMQVAEDALLAFTNELQRVGWEMVDPDEVIRSEAYRTAFLPEGVKEGSGKAKFAAFLKQRHQRKFFTPAGMLPIRLSDKEVRTRYYGDARKDDPKRLLARMAKDLGVDAVVVVQVDYCYEGGALSLLGTGKALMTAASSVKAVDRDGNMIINMRDVPVCGGKGRVKSDSGAGMVNGNLVFTETARDRFRKMFVEATRGNAEKTVARIVRKSK